MSKKIITLSVFVILFISACSTSKYSQNSKQETLKQTESKLIFATSSNEVDNILSTSSPSAKKEGGNTSADQFNTSGWLTYRNDELAFGFKYPKDYELVYRKNNNKEYPWYIKDDFLLADIFLKNKKSNSTVFTFKILNTTDGEKIKYSGGWESVNDGDRQEIGQHVFDVYLFGDSGSSMRVLKIQKKSIVFFGNVEDKLLESILETVE